MIRRKMLVCMLLAGVFILVACAKKGDTGFVEPVKLGTGEYLDVELHQEMHGNATPEETASNAKEKRTCIDAWVNEKGRCVIRYDQELLKAKYDKVVSTLTDAIKTSKARVDVNYECTEVVYHIEKDTTMMDWMWSFIKIGPGCMYIQLLAGVKSEDIKITVRYIYEPTNTEMCVIESSEGFSMTSEEWENMMQEMER